MTSHKASLLCQDIMKYNLLNVVSPSVDTSVHVHRRRHSYQNIYTWILNNQLSNIKSDNLYVLLYSKYYTTRYMVYEKNDLNEPLEDDESLKQKFKALCDKKWTSEVEFNKSYLQIIQEIKPDENTFQCYLDVHKLIESKSKLSVDDKEIFYAGTLQTDIYINRKLASDIKKFQSYKERVIEWLNSYRFINGWITAAGVWVFGVCFSGIIAKNKN